MLITVMIILCIRAYIIYKKESVNNSYLKTKEFKKDCIKTIVIILSLSIISIILTKIQTKFNDELLTTLLFCSSVAIGFLFSVLIWKHNIIIHNETSNTDNTN